jgi:hypothetical protein
MLENFLSLRCFLKLGRGSSQMGPNQMSMPDVSKLQIKNLPIFGAKWPPCDEQRGLEETRFLKKACRPVAASVCREVQRSSLS